MLLKRGPRCAYVCFAFFLEFPQPCTDPRVLDYAGWQTMPGILVLLVDRDGMVERSAGDALLGSRNKWLTVPAGHPPFSVRVKLDEPCPLWEVVSFTLKVKGVHSFFVKLGDQTSDSVQVRCAGRIHHHSSPITLPLPSSRQHSSKEDKREDDQNCSVLYYVRQLCTVIHTHTYEQLIILSIGLGFGF